MQGIVCEQFNQAPAIRDLERPTPGRGQVLVRQAASSVGAGDRLMAAGQPWAFRPVFAAILRPPVLGRDVAGVVEALGEGVEGVAVGDTVIGEAGQAWAEWVLLDHGALAPVPAGVDLLGAAVLPVSGVTALQGLRAGGVREGSRVLVVGASGAVGHLAVQIAAHLGAHTTGVCSAANEAFVRSLGADDVIAYDRERFTDHEGAWDCVFDLAGTEALGACLQTLRPDGRLVSSAGTDGGPWLGPLPRILWTAARSLFDRRIAVLTTSSAPDDLATLLDWVDAGVLRPETRLVDLAAVPASVVNAPGGRGKVVFSLEPAATGR